MHQENAWKTRAQSMPAVLVIIFDLFIDPKQTAHLRNMLWKLNPPGFRAPVSAYMWARDVLCLVSYACAAFVSNWRKKGSVKRQQRLPRNNAATNYKTKMLDFSLAHWQKYPTDNLQIFWMIHFSRTEQRLSEMTLSNNQGQFCENCY